MMFLALLLVASVAVVDVDASSILQSIPFDPFRLECPKMHGVTEVALKMVESAGYQRQDVLFTLACDPIEKMFPPANPELDNLEREDCYWSELFDPIIDTNVNHTCSENEYLAGVSRIAFTSIQLLCCRLRTRQQFKCGQERFKKPVGPDPRQRFESAGSMVSSLAIKNDFYLVRFCQLTQKSIDQISVDLPTTPTTPTTSTTTTTVTTTPSTTSTSTPLPTPSRRTRSTTPTPPTTTPLPSTPAPTLPPKRVIIVTRPRPIFHFPQQPDGNSPGAAPPGAGPPATFDRGFPELAIGDGQRRFIEAAPPSAPAPPEAQWQSQELIPEDEETPDETIERPAAPEEPFIVDAQGLRHFAQRPTGGEAEEQDPSQVPTNDPSETDEQTTFGRTRPLPIVEPVSEHFLDTTRNQLFGVTRANIPQENGQQQGEQQGPQDSQQPRVNSANRPLNPPSSSVSGELSPFEEGQVETATIRIWPSAVRSGGPRVDVTRAPEDVPRRAQERKVTKLTPFATASVSTAAQTASSLPPGWIPFEGIPGVSPDLIRNINFPLFEEDRHVPLDANYVEMSHLVDYPELEQVDNGEQSLAPLIPIPITVQPLFEERSIQQQTTPQQQQQPPKQQQQVQQQKVQQPLQQQQQSPQQQQQPLQQQQQPPQQQQQPPQQQQQPPQLQQQPQLSPQQKQPSEPQAHGQRIQEGSDKEKATKPNANRLKPTTLNLIITTTARSVQETAVSGSNDKIVVFENQYKEKTRKPWPARRPFPDLHGGQLPDSQDRRPTQIALAPPPVLPVQPLPVHLDEQLRPVVAPPAGAAPPSAGPPGARLTTTQAPPRPQQTTAARRTAESDRSAEAEIHEVLTFCTKEIAVKDANRMIIACGIDDDVWQPSHCPIGSECFQVTDSTYRICCFSGGK